MQKMSFTESIEKIAWTDLVCEGINFDMEQKRLSFNTKRYDWTENKEFLAEQGGFILKNLLMLILWLNRM